MRFTGRPKALVFDYKVKLSGHPNRIKETGFSKVKTVAGIDMADCVCFLQKRWEDAKGNIWAKRVGTMVVRFAKTTNGWVENATFPIHALSLAMGFEVEVMGSSVCPRNMLPAASTLMFTMPSTLHVSMCVTSFKHEIETKKSA